MRKRLQLIKEALSIGVVTRKYPFIPAEVPEGFRGLPQFDASKCIGCTACGNVCTPNAITFVDDTSLGIRRLEYYLGRCIFCGRCADVCPTSAITITKEFELASLNDRDLRLVIDIKLIKCQSCGRYFTTFRHLNTVAGKLQEGVVDLVNICPECRRKLALDSLIKLGGLK